MLACFHDKVYIFYQFVTLCCCNSYSYLKNFKKESISGYHPYRNCIKSLWQTDWDLRLACLLLFAFDCEDNFWQLYGDFLPSADECTSLLLATEVCKKTDFASLHYCFIIILDEMYILYEIIEVMTCRPMDYLHQRDIIDILIFQFSLVGLFPVFFFPLLIIMSKD